MKKYIKRGLRLFLFFVILYNYSYSQAILEGRITDSSHSNIIVYEPINNFCNRFITKPEYKLTPDKLGYFKKTIELKLPVFITVTVGVRPIWLYAEPNDTIGLEINTKLFDNNLPNKGVKIKGKNSSGNELYNAFNYVPANKLFAFERMLDSLHFKETLNLNVVDYALSQATLSFDSLLKNKQMTESFHRIVVNDTRGFLITDLIKYAFLSKNVSFTNAKNFAHNLYAKYPVSKEMMRAGLNQSTIAYYYFYSEAREHYLDYHLQDSTLNLNNKFVFINKDFIPWLYAPKDIQEIQWAMNLIWLKKIFASDYGKEDVDAFLSVFPHSQMKEYLQPPYFSYKQNTSIHTDSNSFIFIQADTISTFSSLLSNFKGRRLFVDLWATWCVPCKMEFAYNAQVDSFCNKNNIQRLYVAFELSPEQQNFKKNVYAYNLKGFHLIPNKAITDDIVKRFYPGEVTYNVPHYLLVNEKGEVVNSDAPRPSSGSQLFSTMQSDFKLSY